jgi:Ca-activated chloride channel homolog
MRFPVAAPIAAALLSCAFIASAAVRAGDALTAWSDLWRTPDQQGQALLDAGEPGAAASRFHDPRRRAYADLEAARYKDAAKLLASFTDPESEYNRGNALAKSGQLQAALSAYDAALKQAPADKDIRRNRDLVERALRQQRRSPQSASGNGRAGGQGAASPGERSQSPDGQRNGSGSRRSGGGSQSSGALGAQSTGGSNGGSLSSQPGNAHPGSGGSKESPGQAQRDAALAAAYAARRQRQRGGGNMAPAQGAERNGGSEPAPKDADKQAGRSLAGGTETPRQQPETERQLALDQWLRQIPDSPAGLLQRKFLIEHMMKQESGNPEGGD